jgi:hypothetical protein
LVDVAAVVPAVPEEAPAAWLRLLVKADALLDCDAAWETYW